MTYEERLKDIQDNPKRHCHDYDGLLRCCMVDGAFDTQLIEAHSKSAPLGYNGGVACDVTRGPCACGAWH